MKDVKFEVIRDYADDIRGYKLGDWYLLKHYTWGNQYSWFISKECIMHMASYEWGKYYDTGRVEYVLSCREGKQILRDRYNG